LLLNWKEIDIILNELNLKGALIRQVNQPEHHLVIFQLYTAQNPFTLLFSLSPSSCRLHSTKKKYKNPKKPQRFASFLRAHLRGGRIVDAYQIGHERIIKIVVRKTEIAYLIWVRLWGGAANMIVTDETGKIFDACYRRPGRGEVSGGSYNPETDVKFKEESNKEEKKYEVRALPGTGSFNEKVDAYFASREEGVHKEKIINSLRMVFSERENRLLSSLEKLKKQKDEYGLSERYKELGDLIMSSLYNIKKGDTWLRIKDFYNSNRKIEIELDPHLSPQENAALYYEKYKTGCDGLLRCEQSEKQYDRDLEEIREKQKLLDRDIDMETLSGLAKTYMKKTGGLSASKAPGHHFQSNGFLILVGRSSMENDILLRKHVKGNDYWFHCRDYPGSYIFVKAIKGKSIPLQVMLDAGNLAIFYSKGKESGRGDVYYTQVKYLRRVQKGKRGKVIPTQEKNLYVILDAKCIENLKNSSEVLLHSKG
jgi:predicted ribosome quality control (RQC) complex YloA/Tae2 family protein